MHLRILLSLIGQLIAVPAALFLLPTSLPPSTSDSSSSNPGADCATVTIGVTVDDAAAPAIPVKDRLMELTDKTNMDNPVFKRQVGSDTKTVANDSPHTAEGSTALAPGGVLSALGLDNLVHGVEDAADGFREALTRMFEPLQEIPRRASSWLSHKTGREDEASDTAKQSDSTIRYLAELQQAQESAQRALGNQGWQEVTERAGVTVWKKYFPKDEYGYKYPCVKARGIIHGSAEEVMGMIVDSARVLEYNRYSKGRTDIEHLGPRTKIVWNKAQPPLTSKLHDFCTLMHMELLDDGAFMLITRATEHPQAPLLDGHVRSEILLGVTVLRPVEGDAFRTEMTTVNHIVSNGVPVMIADRVSTKNAIDFIQNVEIAVQAASGASSSTKGQGDSEAPMSQGAGEASAPAPAPAAPLPEERVAAAAAA